MGALTIVEAELNESDQDTDEPGSEQDSEEPLEEPGSD